MTVLYYDATLGDLYHVHKGLGTLGEWWRPANAIETGGANDVGAYVSYALYVRYFFGIGMTAVS